jgi:hypothetical protein
MWYLTLIIVLFKFVGNIFFISVKYGGETIDVQDKDCKMEIVGNIVFKFLMLSLDTLYLNEFLL